MPITVALGPARRVGFPPGHAASFGAVPAAWCWVHRSVPRSSSRAASFPRHPPRNPPARRCSSSCCPEPAPWRPRASSWGCCHGGGVTPGTPPCAPSHPSHCWGGAAGAGGASRGALRPTTAPPLPAIPTRVLLHLLELGFRADFWLNPEAGRFGKGAGHQQRETQRDNTGVGTAEPTAGCCSSPLYTKLPFFPSFAAISAFFFFFALCRGGTTISTTLVPLALKRPHQQEPDSVPSLGTLGGDMSGRTGLHAAGQARFPREPRTVHSRRRNFPFLAFSPPFSSCCSRASPERGQRSPAARRAVSTTEPKGRRGQEGGFGSDLAPAAQSGPVGNGSGGSLHGSGRFPSRGCDLVPAGSWYPAADASAEPSMHVPRVPAGCEHPWVPPGRQPGHPRRCQERGAGSPRPLPSSSTFQRSPSSSQGSFLSSRFVFYRHPIPASKPRLETS